MTPADQIHVSWSDAERHAWRWPESLRPSQWAAQNRVLQGHDNAEPGPWRNERTPYLVGIMDATTEPGVERIVVMKGAQIGFSESIRNLLGFWIDHEPGPALVVMPDQNSAEALVEERIMPLIEHTPAIARHRTSRAWDIKKSAIRLATMSIYLGWAGSSQALKSRPIRYLLLEEPDEYPKSSGGGGDPISKAMKRVSTFQASGRARVILGGTPTTRDHNTFKQFSICDQRRYFWVPCPLCNQYQQLIWGTRGDSAGVKWETPAEPDRAKRAAIIESERRAYYRCEHCRGRIDETAKPWMIARGKWAGEDQAVTPEGKLVGPTPSSNKAIGFCISSIYSPWVSWSLLAAEFVLAKYDAHAMMDFVNQRLAEPFEEKISEPAADEFAAKRDQAKAQEFKPGLAPDWTGIILASVDVQAAGMWLLVRAWGYRYRSRLLYYTYLRTWDELYDRVVNSVFMSAAGQPFRIERCVLDSGGTKGPQAQDSRTQEVYRFCERAPGYFIPLKGASNPQIRTVRPSPYAKDAAGKPVPLFTIDTNRLKTDLMRLVRIAPGQDGEWQIHDQVEDEYLEHMTAEHQIVIDPKTQERGWVLKPNRRNNHLWDCEVYQLAAADTEIGRVALIPSPEERIAQQRMLEDLDKARAQAAAGRQQHWIPPRPEGWSNR